MSMGFSRQEYWSELPFPPPRDLPNPGVKPASLALAGKLFTIASPEMEFSQWLNGRNTSVMQEIQFCSLGWEDSLEKEMATHSSILA